MKKIFLFVPTIMALLFFASCNDNSKVKQFMNELSAAVAANDRAAIEKMYPDAVKADSLSCVFDEDKAQIEETEDGYKVVFDEGKELILVKNEADGSLTVKESHGIFAYSKERMDIGTKTGWIEPGMSDQKIAEQFADTLFVNFLADKLKAKLKVVKCGPVSTNYASGTSKYGITVRNDNEFDVPAEGYAFVLTEKGWDVEKLRDVVVGTKVIDGVDIKAHDTAFCPVPGTYDFEYSTVSASIRIKAENLMKFFIPEGGEYEEYKRSSK